MRLRVGPFTAKRLRSTLVAAGFEIVGRAAGRCSAARDTTDLQRTVGGLRGPIGSEIVVLPTSREAMSCQRRRARHDVDSSRSTRRRARAVGTRFPWHRTFHTPERPRIRRRSELRTAAWRRNTEPETQGEDEALAARPRVQARERSRDIHRSQTGGTHAPPTHAMIQLLPMAPRARMARTAPCPSANFAMS